MPQHGRTGMVVLGASALTAREVLRHLTTRAPEVGLSWAVAGRDEGRLRAALDAADVDPDDLLIADVDDSASLSRLAARSRVVLNLVGPYARSAEAVVDACIGERAHYLDLTGETLFLRRMIDRHDDRARSQGVRVVQPCGFESLPVDLLLGLAWDALDEADVGPLRSFDVEFSLQRVPRGLRPGDAVSGGTIRSLVEMLSDDDVRRVFDPALLIVDPVRADEVRRTSPLRLRPGRTPGGRARAPLFPAPTINPPVIHRSAALLGRPPLRYREGARIPGPLPIALPAAAAVSALYGVARTVSASARPVRRAVGTVLDRVVPPSGAGPAAERMVGWTWRLDGVASPATGDPIAVGVTGEGHPGYFTTARMAAEAALALADDGDDGSPYGFLTPLAALGTRSADRLARAGLRFDARPVRCPPAPDR